MTENDMKKICKICKCDKIFSIVYKLSTLIYHICDNHLEKMISSWFLSTISMTITCWYVKNVNVENFVTLVTLIWPFRHISLLLLLQNVYPKIWSPSKLSKVSQIRLMDEGNQSNISPFCKKIHEDMKKSLWKIDCAQFLFKLYNLY
jgi:hypothetical protein